MEPKNCPFCNAEMFKIGNGEIEHPINDCLMRGERIYRVDKWNRRASGWVPVGERLPEEMKPVILYAPHHWGVFCGWRGRHEKHNCVYFETLQDFFREDQITHWQPLPEPPV